MAAITITVYNLLAVWQHNETYMLATVPFRIIGGAWFLSWREPWPSLVWWEWAHALVLAVCLAWARVVERCHVCLIRIPDWSRSQVFPQRRHEKDCLRPHLRVSRPLAKRRHQTTSQKNSRTPARERRTNVRVGVYGIHKRKDKTGAYEMLYRSRAGKMIVSAIMSCR